MLVLSRYTLSVLVQSPICNRLDSSAKESNQDSPLKVSSDFPAPTQVSGHDIGIMYHTRHDKRHDKLRT